MILLRHAQSHFNVHFAKTRVDPGIEDPELTDEGLKQAHEVASELLSLSLKRIVASPYTRALQTASILSAELGLTIEVEPLVRERAFFICDIGTPRSKLSQRWPDIDFSHLPERWWPEPEESESELLARCRHFATVMAESQDWAQVLVVTHWGFIRGLTGQGIGNAQLLQFDPTLAA